MFVFFAQISHETLHFLFLMVYFLVVEKPTVPTSESFDGR